MTGNRITLGPFLKIESPTCPKVGKSILFHLNLYLNGYVNEEIDDEIRGFFDWVKGLKEQKHNYNYDIVGNYLLTSKRSNNGGLCSDSKVVEKYLRIK